ncbi:MAG: hypothetical protein JST86_08515 [Bacteroidetes bacterium]|nr:hypothetical protein [Bacteroidota bacterium]
MKNVSLLCVVLIVLLNACVSRAKQLIAKKWDCIKIENLDPIDKRFLAPEDSLAAVKMETVLQTLSWTFNSNNTYFCSTIGNKITVEGTYQLDDDSTLIMIPLSKNNINTYHILSISEQQLTLTSTSGTTVPLILHFGAN